MSVCHLQACLRAHGDPDVRDSAQQHPSASRARNHSFHHSMQASSGGVGRSGSEQRLNPQRRRGKHAAGCIADHIAAPSPPPPSLPQPMTSTTPPPTAALRAQAQ
eukprot:908873-Rhodomonas_salina.1